ncbi:MAG: LacI family transcriptional regulator [Lachnospiraceae bacterium]|nr:LacI family transcriptional regulator [Lachnospiraceae bacterium]
MVTIKDIAKECGVSIATVSNVINGKNKAGEKTQKKILEVVEKYGYRPNQVAKGLRSKRSGIIGIIVEDIAQFTIPNIVEGIMQHIEEYGYKSMLINLRLYSRWSDKWFHNEDMLDTLLKQSLSEMEAMQADGLVYVAVHARDLAKIPKDIGIPAVMTYAHELNPEVPSVMVDDELSAYEAVRYLLDKGHKKVAIIGGREDNMHTELRLKGAERALNEAGIEVDKNRLIYANWNRQEGYKAACKLFSGGDFDSIFCMTDRMAGGVYQYMHEHGIVPGRDYSVIGYDGQDLSGYLVPGLTTMALPLERIGEVASALLIEKLEGVESGIELDDNVVRVPCTFIERGSVKDAGR